MDAWPSFASLTFAILTASGAAAEARAPVVERPDGSTVSWYLVRQAAGPRQGILVLAQGSGCASVTTNQNIAAAKRLLADFAVVTVDKYGVAPGADPRSPEDCSKSFYAHHTVSQRVEDYRAVITRAEALPWWNGQLVLFGGSEGGAVVQILASQVKADAAVIYSAATGMLFRDAFIQVLPPEMAAEVPSTLEAVRRNPTSAKVWGGNSYRWWADIMDRPLWEDALKARAPLLAVQGRRDASNPVSSARAFRDAFAAQKRCNLTYWEYPDYDHAMTDAAGASHRPEVFTRISAWLRARLDGVPMPDCDAIAGGGAIQP
ncbi:MAG: hypothetical protein JWQ29_1997, partial [Phenylobacterium sp.]|nr:hypothetical protein [Phenylobacterium sp.]